MEAVFALIGVVIGGAVTTHGQFRLRRKEWEHSAKQVARSFVGEIEGLLSIHEFRDYSGSLRKTADLARKGELTGIVISASREYFRIFDANADKLGLLPGDVSEQIAKFYVRASALYEDLRSTRDFLDCPPDERARIYDGMADLLDGTLVIGRKAVSDLREFASK